MFSNDFAPKKPLNFYCEKCDYLTCNKKDYNRHCQTKKHFSNVHQSFSPKKTPDDNYSCMCGHSYKDNSGLWRHKKTCKQEKLQNQINNDITPELIMEIIKQNKELQQTLIEQNKTIIELAKNTGNNICNSNNHSNNKTFNLQVYLNETCKDAINLSDFVNQIQVSIGDLERVGETGYAEGISKVFIKNLNDIEVDERPIHCSDFKRETLYIKDNNQWTKDDEEKTVLTKAITSLKI
jgi:hypothetical protein